MFLYIRYIFVRLPCAAPLSPSKAPSEVLKCNFWWRSHLCEEGESFAWVRALAMNSWPRHSGPVFCSSSFSIVNEEDRRGRGLLVLIYPEGSLGITINSPLLAHSTSLHRHCQFVPIREAGFWVSAVRSRSGPTGESHPDYTGPGCTLIPWGRCGRSTTSCLFPLLHILKSRTVNLKCCFGGKRLVFFLQHTCVHLPYLYGVIGAGIEYFRRLIWLSWLLLSLCCWIKPSQVESTVQKAADTIRPASPHIDTFIK